MQFKPKINRAIQRTYQDSRISAMVHAFNGKEKTDEMVNVQKFWSERHQRFIGRGKWIEIGVNRELWMAMNESFYANKYQNQFDGSDPHDI